MVLIEKYLETIRSVEYLITNDFESTGTDVMRCDWITGSFGKIRISDFQTLDELEVKSRPNHWDEDARKIHRISRQTAAEYPERSESLQKVIDFLPPRSKFAFVCHANPTPFNQNIRQRVNTHFDLALLKWDFLTQERYFDFHKYFDESKVISTQFIAREYFGLAKELNLEQVCEKLGIKMIGNHHDARADRLASEQILRRFMNENGFFNVGNGHAKLDFAISEIQENNGMEKQQRFGL